MGWLTEIVQAHTKHLDEFPHWHRFYFCISPKRNGSFKPKWRHRKRPISNENHWLANSCVHGLVSVSNLFSCKMTLLIWPESNDSVKDLWRKCQCGFVICYCKEMKRLGNRNAESAWQTGFHLLSSFVKLLSKQCAQRFKTQMENRFCLPFVPKACKVFFLSPPCSKSQSTNWMLARMLPVQSDTTATILHSELNAPRDFIPFFVFEGEKCSHPQQIVALFRTQGSSRYTLTCVL